MVMTLSTLELTQLRAEAEGYLPDTCTLQTVARTRDSMGGWTESYSNTYTAIPCRIWQQTGGERDVAGRMSEVTRWVLNVAHDQALDATMRVVHGGNTYQVNDVNDDGSERLQRRAWLTRIE